MRRGAVLLGVLLVEASSGHAGAAPSPRGSGAPAASVSPPPAPSLAAPPASAAPPLPAPSAAAPPASATGAAHRSGPTCTEHLAGASQRPATTEQFPDKGKSGYTAELRVDVVHGKGETVLPTGFRVKLGDELAALEKAGFYLPAADGVGAPSAVTVDQGARAKTTLTIPLLLLPSKSGRQTLTLPPVPVAVSRASGSVITLCTQPHQIVVEDPTANDPNPTPRGNPRPRPQLEEWTAAKNAAIGAAIALLVGALVAWLATWWMRRERPKPPPPPPRPPWEVALEELFDIEQSRLVEQGRFAVQFDRVSHVVRRYLGDRYGFDGLESTTHEIMAELGRIVPPVPVLDTIEASLEHADLVKFAKATPTEAECVAALERGREIVERTIPAPVEKAPPARSEASDAEGVS